MNHEKELFISCKERRIENVKRIIHSKTIKESSIYNALIHIRKNDKTDTSLLTIIKILFTRLSIHRNINDIFIHYCEYGDVSIIQWLLSKHITKRKKINIHVNQNRGFIVSLRRGNVDIAQYLMEVSSEDQPPLFDIHLDKNRLMLDALNCHQENVMYWLVNTSIKYSLESYAMNDYVMYWRLRSSISQLKFLYHMWGDALPIVSPIYDKKESAFCFLYECNKIENKEYHYKEYMQCAKNFMAFDSLTKCFNDDIASIIEEYAYAQPTGEYVSRGVKRLMCENVTLNMEAFMEHFDKDVYELLFRKGFLTKHTQETHDLLLQM